MTFVVRTTADAALLIPTLKQRIWDVDPTLPMYDTSVFAEGAQRVGVGVLVGLAGSLAATRLVAALLYQVSPTDPLTLGATTMLLGTVALLACYWPARRATRIDPLVALRSD
jgi:ABC-type antimicrobial peptide transport system permease subunit